MNKPRRRYSMQEKLEILYEAGQHGTTHIQSKYNLSPDIVSRWEKDLKKSKTRQAAIKKQGDAQVIESLKAEIEQLKKLIAKQTPLQPNSGQVPKCNEATTSTNADEFYRLVASLIVQNLLNEVDEESGHSQMLNEA